MRSRRVTLADVAEELDVAVSTVWRALNEPGRLNSDTEDAVLTTARRLGYRVREASATPEVRPRTDSVTVVVPGLSPYFTAVLRGVSTEASKTGADVVLVEGQRGASLTAAALDRLTETVGDLVLVSSAWSDDDLRRLAAARSTVVTNREVTGVAGVGVDTTAGATDAVRHLHALGHRSVQYLAGPGYSVTATQRWHAVEAACTSLGVRVTSTLPHAPTYGGGSSAILTWSGTASTAVIAYNDHMAIGALMTVKRAGVRVPEDLSIVGFDDAFGAEFCDPALTTVAVPSDELGRAAYARLTDGPQGPSPHFDALHPALVVRGSTAPPR